jgi:hypothetical protein
VFPLSVLMEDAICYPSASPMIVASVSHRFCTHTHTKSRLSRPHLIDYNHKKLFFTDLTILRFHITIQVTQFYKLHEHLSHPVLRTKANAYMYARIKFHTYSDFIVNNQ